MKVARAVAWRNIHNWVTNPSMLVPSLLFPLFFFTAFAGGLSRVDSIPGFDYEAGYTTFVYGFVLLQASAFGGIFTGLLGGARLRVGLLAPADARRGAAGRHRRRATGCPPRCGRRPRSP